MVERPVLLHEDDDVLDVVQARRPGHVKRRVDKPRPLIR
jgi:hypothetical protein